MANKRTALKGKKTDPAAQPVQDQTRGPIKRCHRSTHEILSKLRQVMTDFFAIDDHLSYDVDTITFEDEIMLRISCDNARMDVRIVSLLQEGGVR
ncbi:hypothetical protein CS544_02590 [Porphyromonas gingivalis]|nr:hypothetical protein [Porphyromonas gingivalis]ATR90088.1 hypothetical protein CS544_02590 [Porphyromonas gingivalis]